MNVRNRRLEEESLLEECETTLTGHFRRKDIVPILMKLISERETWKGLVNRSQEETVSTQRELSNAQKELDRANKAKQQAMSELLSARALPDRDYIDIGGFVWFSNGRQRWRTDTIRSYTVDANGHVESINGVGLTGSGHKSTTIFEKSFVKILEIELRSEDS